MHQASGEPAPLHVSAPRLDRDAAGWRLSATFRLDGREWDVFFHSTEMELACVTEPFLALGLPAAMLHRRPLELESAVSPALLARLPEFQRRWLQADPRLATTKVRAPTTPEPAPKEGRETLLFFSGGVDSFHSLLEHGSELTGLLFVDGLDIQVHQRDLYVQVRHRIQEAAAAFHLRLLGLETNLRTFTDALGHWGHFFHGPAKAAIAHALSPRVRCCYVSGENIPPISRDSSRAELDPLWSTSTVEIAHVGHQFTRFQKLQRISPDARVRQFLRVCWENRGGQYNCGECSKCQRNMAALRALGRLEQTATFDRGVDLRYLAKKLDLPGNHSHESIAELAVYLREAGTDPELLAALEAALTRRIWEQRYPSLHQAKRFCEVLPTRVGRKVRRLLSRSQ